MGYFVDMNDLVILGIVLAGIMVSLFIWQHFEHKKSTLELKMFQMENSRIIQQLAKSTEQMEKTAQQRHEENMTYFQGIMQSIARVIRRQEEGEGPK